MVLTQVARAFPLLNPAGQPFDPLTKLRPLHKRLCSSYEWLEALTGHLLQDRYPNNLRFGASGC
jgi:hypothetical protein